MAKRKALEKKPRQKDPDSWAVTWTSKISIAEAQELEKKILFYAKGNRSAYTRAALLNYKPKLSDFE